MQSLNDFQKLQNTVRLFCDERDWSQFHSPKDLAIGVSTEANELLELFRFKSDSEIAALFEQTEFKLKVEQELADVLFFVLRFAERHHIDLVQAFDAKMQLNAEKYSIAKARGSNKKYTEL